ncbi:MAG: bifunctional nuclease family protein [Clostridiales bacterium]|nr:bifunctional nuclease family protein [Clostridiales bacterium]
MIELTIKGVSVDPTGNFFVLLVDDKDTNVLPINIGKLEAQSIAIPIEGIDLPRPMTHDLLKSTIESLGGKTEKIVITGIENDTYFAEIYISQQGKEIILDSRPSDAIALALRCDAPVFMEFKLIEFTYDLSDISLK